MARTTDTPVSQPTLGNYISVIGLGLIWGGTFMVVAVALQGYGPVTVATARVTLGALALLSLVVAMGRPLPAWSPLLGFYVVVLGILTSALPFMLLSWGQQYVPSAFAGLSMAVLPLFVLPLAHWFVPGDRLTARKASGFGLGLCGALVLLGPGITAAGGGDLVALGRIACIAATVCYAAGSILTRRCPAIDGLWLSALTLIVGSVILLPAMLVIEGLPGAADPVVMGAILFLGLVPTAFAAFLRVQVIRSAGPSFMTLVNYQVPVWSMLFGALVLSEVLPPRFFVALALIALGLAISQSGRRRGG
ncbi:Permease of the drug/metabolite transporter (DMT) superfamily [Jannaschia faecimaris]|uniref:Permease of the drug/metabolite transporter (DMT) superfamily n=1 Tax=Jannaschia faecimaris TaxID=1244108 RepID=A0A1H3QDG3_9RHOB|nr:DMT family transporter [Jannaschia faecimaris]SDZ10769.1 Permease of the drug/metabolite transporter (DMT) superfamily [Jannaschia faecimaris]